jgi:hypothetical protein
LDWVNYQSNSVVSGETAQEAFAADGPSSVFVEVGLGTLGQSFVERFVAAAEMQALGGSIQSC